MPLETCLTLDAEPIEMTAAPDRPIRAVIADDERLMRDQLRSRLAEVWPELQIVGEARNGLEAVELTRDEAPDLVFLDIRMPGMTGVEAARAIAQMPVDEASDLPAVAPMDRVGATPPDASPPASTPGWRGCEIVFITAYDEYAIEAFEQGVVDYVLKPAERERLALTVARVKQRLARRLATFDVTADRGDVPPPAALQLLLQKLAARLEPEKAPRLQWVQASVGQTIQMIPVDEVLFFISDEKYTRVQTATLEALIRKPIKELIEELDAAVFWQIHRSTLVNTRFIAGVSRDFRGRQLVAVRGHREQLEVSRSFSGRFKGM